MASKIPAPALTLLSNFYGGRLVLIVLALRGMTIWDFGSGPVCVGKAQGTVFQGKGSAYVEQQYESRYVMMS